MGKDGRVGGLNVDPAVRDWQRSAAENAAALTKKQRKDRQRTTAKYDLPKWLKEAIIEAAQKTETSASQMAAFLMAWGLRLYLRRDVEMVDAIWMNKEKSATLRFESNLNIPREVEREIRSRAEE